MKKHILAPSILALFVASTAHAGATFDTTAGTLNLGADVEFDYTTQDSKQEALDTDLYSSGRLLLDINGQKVLDNGNFAAFKLNPVWGQDGSAGADDIYIKFGQMHNWALQAGHFEATDLSPAGQDTYIAESGTVMYRANFARGRTNVKEDQTGADGQMTFTKTMGDSAMFELTAQSLNEGKTVVVRPVVTGDLGDSVTMAVGAELPAVADNDDYYSITGEAADDGKDWLGFGGHVTWQTTENLALTARAAYLMDERVDANNIDAYTAGLNAQYQNFFISALYGEADADDDAYDSEEIQVYASYRIPAILDIDNFDIYLGAGYSDSKVADENQDDVIGGRVRLKYIF
jgi:hypothetical protein